MSSCELENLPGNESGNLPVLKSKILSVLTSENLPANESKKLDLQILKLQKEKDNRLHYIRQLFENLKYEIKDLENNTSGYDRSIAHLTYVKANINKGVKLNENRI
jgi:hypothetical protein